MNHHSQCTDRNAAAAPHVPPTSVPVQRPLGARAAGLVRLIGDGHDLDELSPEVAAGARVLADKARAELTRLVKFERGYAIGDTVRECAGGPHLKVEGFRLAHTGRIVVVVLRRLLDTGAPSGQTHTRVLDSRFEMVQDTDLTPA